MKSKNPAKYIYLLRSRGGSAVVCAKSVREATRIALIGDCVYTCLGRANSRIKTGVLSISIDLAPSPCSVCSNKRPEIGDLNDYAYGM